MNRAIFCCKHVLVLAFAALTLSSVAQQQNTAPGFEVKGKVIDAGSKMPVAAAQISIPNKNLSAVTDENGTFVIKAASANDVLHVTAYDYNNVEVPVRGNTELTIELYSDAFTPYFKKITGFNGLKDYSASTGVIKSIDNLSHSNVMTADDAIQTELNGDLRGISRSATTGVGSSLFIRGINSINANAQPLFVVDGVIWNSMYDVESIHQGFFSNPLSGININDVEDITVIKDGTSVYGSKGSNGVILIKTKRATSMVTKIDVNVLTGITTTPSSVPMMDGEQYRIFASDMLGSKGVSVNNVSNYGFLVIDPSNPIYNTYHNNTNWANQVYQTGNTNSYLINAAGGDEKALYYFSVGLTNNKGIVKTTNLQRINARFNADFKLSNNLTMAMNIGFSRLERKLLDDGMSKYSSPAWMAQIKSPFLSPYSFTAEGNMTENFAYTDEFNVGSPLGLIYGSVNNYKNYRFNIDIAPSYKITPELTLSTQFDYNLYKTIEGHFRPMYYTPVQYLEEYKGNSYNQIQSQAMRNTGFYDETRLTYDKKFNALNTVKAIYGFRFLSNFYESDYVTEHNSGSNNNTIVTGSYDYLSVNGINNLSKSISNYLDVDYDYDNRYFLNAVVSMDASSRFGRMTDSGIHLLGASWGLFPSISGAWLVSSEKFMKNVKLINFLKLRAGYSVTGNDGIRDYESMAYFQSVRFYDRANGLVLSNLENTKIQWETTGRANLGIDLTVLKEILSLSFDYYSAKTTNLLTLRDLPEITGLGKYWSNGGEMTNNGFEFSANLKALNLKNFKWELGASAGHYVNTVTALPGNESYITQVYDGEVITKVGQSAAVFYGYKTDGVFSTQTDADAANLKIVTPKGADLYFAAGDVKFMDVNNDGIINDDDKQVIGNPNPDFYGNISSKWTIGPVSLSALCTYSYGNDVYNYYRSQLEAGSDFSNQTTAMVGRWTADGQVTNQPRAVWNDPIGNSRFSDRWIEDGSYLKLKWVTLAYDLPLKSKFIEGVNIWLSAENLYTFTNYLGTDPEFSTNNSVYYQGVDAGLLPQTKAYYVGIKLKL